MCVAKNLHLVMAETPTSHSIPIGEKILILPLGSWEQHGPHLPLDTDSVIIARVVHDALLNNPHANRCLCAPLLPITASDEHHGFAGGLSTGTDALTSAVVAICRSASSWAAGTLIVNGHGGNFDALQLITSALQYENITHAVWSLPSYDGGDMHAGHTETSLMMHIAPDAVRSDLIESITTPPPTVNQLRDVGVAGVSPSGVIGNPATATAQHGRDVLTMYVRSLSEKVETCSNEWLSASA